MDSVAYSIRFNTDKTTAVIQDVVPWEKNGTFIEKKEFYLDPNWHSGTYYVQESNSMFLGYILEQLNVKEKNLTILDACAAPGGKSTSILSKISEDSVLISNEILPKRNAILRENLIRWGNSNCIITQNDTKNFKSLNNYFDIIVIDAPCSGEGLLRKHPELAHEFTPENIQKCAIRQTEILDNLIHSVKDNGYIIYSTCTFQQIENEEQIKYLLNNNFNLVDIDISAFPEIQTGKLPHTFYFNFENTKGSGFFIACLQKKSNSQNQPIHFTTKERNRIELTKFNQADKWIENYTQYNFYNFKNSLYVFPKKISSVLEDINPFLNITNLGVEIGELKKDIFIPAHALALSKIKNKSIPYLSVDLDIALKYLRKQDIELSNFNSEIEGGWYLLNYENNAIGWIKVLPNRINNYLPNNWRILK